MKKALLVSVGGSPNPIIYSINRQTPEYLIFFASKDSRGIAIEKILPALEYQPKDREFIMTEDEQDIEKSVSAILKELPAKLKIWGLNYSDLSADYTGGTKTMSAALVLALSDFVDTFSYVGGTERDKAGLGTVIDGREQMLHLKNPWNELAVNRLKEIELHFNSCRFVAAENAAEDARNRTTSRSHLFEAIQYTAKAFALWDNFQYKKAFNELKRAESLFRALSAESANRAIVEFAKNISQSLDIIQKISDSNNEEDRQRALTIDIISNAIRRGDTEHKYDDAVARLYSAIEKMAKMRLKSAFGIDNSDLKEEQIPEIIREEILNECRNGREDKIQIPLHKSFMLLATLKDSVGIAYLSHCEDLGKVLVTRNNSLLAHGFDPVKEETYKKMLEISLKFIGSEKNEITKFPKLKITENL